MDMATTLEPTEVDRNFAAFQDRLPELMGSHLGKFAVMHNGAIAEFFDSMGDAVRYGHAQFGEVFSVQEVTSKNVNLGFYSYAVHHLPN